MDAATGGTIEVPVVAATIEDAVVVGVSVDEVPTAGTTFEDAAILVASVVEATAIVEGDEVGASVTGAAVEVALTITSCPVVITTGGLVSNEKTTGLGLICLGVTVSLGLSVPNMLIQVDDIVWS